MNKALIIGIDEYPKAPLNQCVNDALKVVNYLIENKLFKPSEIRTACTPRSTTTKAIIERIKWLKSGLRIGDKILIYYSGHGYSYPLRDRNGVITHIEEGICPIDFEWGSKNRISDSNLIELISVPFSKIDLYGVFDSCHSGGLVRSRNGTQTRIREYPADADIIHRRKIAKEKNITPVLQYWGGCLLTACMDSQESQENENGGIFTANLLKSPPVLSNENFFANAKFGTAKENPEQTPQIYFGERSERLKSKLFLGN